MKWAVVGVGNIAHSFMQAVRHIPDITVVAAYGRNREKLDAFCDKYGNQMSNPFVLGYYCHLYMDALFMRTSWKRHFSFFD